MSSNTVTIEQVSGLIVLIVITVLMLKDVKPSRIFEYIVKGLISINQQFYLRTSLPFAFLVLAVLVAIGLFVAVFFIPKDFSLKYGSLFVSGMFLLLGITFIVPDVLKKGLSLLASVLIPATIAILIQYTYFQWIEYEGISSEIAFSRVYDVISAVTWSVLLLVMKSIVSIYVQNKVKEAYFAQQVPISPQEGFNNNSNEKQF